MLDRLHILAATAAALLGAAAVSPAVEPGSPFDDPAAARASRPVPEPFARPMHSGTGRDTRATADPEAGLHFVAVVGAVRQPGAFAVRASTLQLSSLLHAAGGLSPNATGSLRVVRGGEAWNAAYAPGVKLPLAGGDVVVVDESGPAAPAGAGGARARAPETPRVVHVACVNVIERPVVLALPIEAATPGGVVRWLGQDDEIIGLTRVLVPSHAWDDVRQTGIAATTPLADGTVIVFERRTVRRELLPVGRLPDAIAVESRFSAGPPREQPGEHDVQPQRFERSQDAAQVFPPADELHAHADELRGSPEEHTVPGTRAADRVAMNSPSGVVTAEAVRELPTEAVSIALASPELPFPAPEPVTAAPAVGAIAAGSRSPGHFGLFLGGSLAGLALFAGLWLRRRHSRQVARHVSEILGPPAAAPATIAFRREPPRPRRPADQQRLEELIRDELPLVEEAVQLPERLEFHGRAATTLVRRVDAAHTAPPVPPDGPAAPESERPQSTLAGPHFARRTTAAVTVGSNEPRRTTSASSGRTRRIDPAAASTLPADARAEPEEQSAAGPGPLDRALERLSRRQP